MLLSVIKYFRGYVHVKLTGYAPERFLNLCGNRNILIWNFASVQSAMVIMSIVRIICSHILMYNRVKMDILFVSVSMHSDS